MKKRILIADDDADIAYTLSEILHDAGFETALASSAKDAYNMLAAQPFDLLLTDINMPELNGFALKKMIKQCEALNGMPVIFMSGYSPYIERAPSVVLIKPFNTDDLLSVIEMTLMSEAVH
ncbi:response regulator [Oxalicibacterium faecigallinarum]|uniref:Response regulatory domain-containing protein n=1 Tax=Oxalicibacterium faecigallinarum TaxID=573741 RepID=A0A8J3ALJ2_9BURK|nr:response regulator [Oxalicibacterium faecigallinarum]GGI15908.1 hypothetical protein GCM10008066_01310 [Oxalicibacterium faecigallinarum]